MNDHDTFEQYFADRAPHLDTAPAGISAVARRGRARRHRRTGVRVAAVVGVLAVGGGIVAQGRSTGDDQQVDTQTAVPSKLAWTLVDAPKGIGGFGLNSAATTADGAIYQLSTGPGSTFDGPGSLKRVLYRSTDEVTWEPAELPSGLSASALAADGDRLYALGTAPAGGGVGVRLASSVGGSGWSTTDVPLDIAALDRSFPGKIVTSGVQVAAARGTTVVVVSVRGELDADAVAADIEGTGGWTVTPAGIDVFRSCEEDPATETTEAPTAGATTSTVVTGTEPADDPAAADAAKRGCAAVDEEPSVERSFTWAELGLTPDQGQLANGRTYVFTATDGGNLAQTGVLAGGSWQPAVLATDAGFWVVRDLPTQGGFGTTSALRSPDGRDWTGAPVEVPGALVSSGVLAGRPALAVSTEAGQDLVVLGSGGPQTTHLDSVIDGGPNGFVSSTAAIGRLGVAFTYTSGMGEDGTGGRTVVVHSADGTTFAQQEVPGAPEGRVERPNNVSVSADAVVVRLNSYPKGSIPGDGSVRPTQRAFVGTPD